MECIGFQARSGLAWLPTWADTTSVCGVDVWSSLLRMCNLSLLLVDGNSLDDDSIALLPETS